LTGILHLFNFKAISIRRNTWIKIAIFLISFFGVTAAGFAQNISGQWIGNFTSEEDPEGNGTDYVLEIEANGNQLSGYSYTYFSIAGKRYYVICRLKGTYDKGSKSIDVKEIETIKTNTPPDFENCHQWHQLTYLKQKDKETLVGKWKPYEKESTCGKGFTTLERKALVRENTNPSVEKTTPAPKVVTKTNPSTPKPPTTTTPKNQPIAKAIQKPQTPLKPTIKPNTPPAPKTVIKPVEEKAKETKEEVPAPPKGAQQSVKDNFSEKKNTDKPVVPFENGKAKNIPDNTKEKLAKRTYQVIKVIEVTHPNIKVDIYDNGQVDGDVVSIYLNDKQLISSKMLTAQPITIQIKIEENDDVYDLIMYAESLGSIPPNTAFMIVTTPTQRYEINISSNEQTSGAIRFKLKK